MIGDIIRGHEKDLAEELFDFDEDEVLSMLDASDEEYIKKELKDERANERFFGDVGKNTLMDLATGWMPSIVDNMVKKGVNRVADQFVSDDELAELEAMGLDKEDFIRIYDQNPGVLGLLTGQSQDLVNAISIIRNPELDDKFKKPAYLLLSSLALQEGNMNKISKKLLYQAAKADKALRKEMDNASK